MPRRDGTGPMGYGPMTGRGAGYCAGYETPGSMNSAFPAPYCGRGRGFWGRGGGRGWRNSFYATGLPRWARSGWSLPSRMQRPPVGDYLQKQELEQLQEQAKYFSGALEDINQRIEELRKDKQS